MTKISKTEPTQPEAVAARPTTPPRVDIFENKDEYLIIAEVPGATQDALDVQLDDELVTLRAKVGSEIDAAQLKGEYRATDFARSFVIPAEVDRARVTAHLDKGVLELHLPKSEAARPRRIPITAG